MKFTKHSLVTSINTVQYRRFSSDKPHYIFFIRNTTLQI